MVQASRVVRDDFSIAAPGGSRIVPKVRIISAGTEHPLESLILNGEALCLGAVWGTPMKDKYDSVRIWSPAPLSVKRVSWHSSDK